MAKKKPTIAPLKTKVTAKTEPEIVHTPAPDSAEIKKGRWSDGSDKKETMVYIYDDVMFRMDMMQAKTKIKYRNLGKRKYNNSALVNIALDMLLTDYEENGEDSQLLQSILND